MGTVCMEVPTPPKPISSAASASPQTKKKKIKIPPALPSFRLVCNAGFDLLGTEPLAVLSRREMSLPRGLLARGMKVLVAEEHLMTRSEKREGLLKGLG